MKNQMIASFVLVLALAACSIPAGATGTATPTPIQLQEFDRIANYMIFTSSIGRDHLTTLELALETASIDSSVRIAESFEAAAANLESLWQYQDDIEAHRVRFTSMPAPQRAWHFEGLMLESFSNANEGIEVLVGGYAKYAEDRGFPTRADIEAFAKTRAQAVSLLVAALSKAKDAMLEESASIADELQKELDRLGAPNLSVEQKYLLGVNAVVDRFYNHRKDYNDGLERIGEQIRSAATQAEQRRALEQAVAHLESAHRFFQQDRDDFAQILPPFPFRDFHLLMNRAFNDYVGATSAFITYYSQNLNQGIRDLELANSASALIVSGNESLQRAGYMYAELVAQR
jgi:hypothetical protein